jgi:hypothetical protein
VFEVPEVLHDDDHLFVEFEQFVLVHTCSLDPGT